MVRLTAGVILCGAVSCTSAAEPCAQRVSRNMKSLSAEEKRELVDGWHRLKSMPSAYADGLTALDFFVEAHLNATLPSALVHSGWKFFPWHREFMHRVAAELRRATGNPALTVPYWDWTDEESTDALFAEDYMGGSGEEGNGYALTTGNFGPKHWQILPKFRSIATERRTDGALVRAFGNGLLACVDAEKRSRHFFLGADHHPRGVDSRPSVGPFQFVAEASSANAPEQFSPPQSEDVGSWLAPSEVNLRCAWDDWSCTKYYSNQSTGLSLECRHYGGRLPTAKEAHGCVDADVPYSPDSGPQNLTVPSTFFRACMEGDDIHDEYAYTLEMLGASLHHPHGNVHSWLGGSADQATGPNDPIFMHHHANVDRLWARKQRLHGLESWFDRTGFGKQEAFPGVPAEQSLDIVKAYGFQYDTECSQGSHSMMV